MMTMFISLVYLAGFLAVWFLAMMCINYVDNPTERNPFKQPYERARWCWFPKRIATGEYKWLCWIRRL